MPTSHPTTPTFELRIEFVGPMLHIVEPSKATVNVIMPDARFKGVRERHADDSEAVPHVGYLRFDMAALTSGALGDIGGISAENPSYEVIHRFDREELQMGVVGGEAGMTSPILPDLGAIAPTMQPLATLLDAVPPEIVLMRTTLVGGKMESVLSGGSWSIGGELRGGASIAAQQYASIVRWRCMVAGTGLTIRLVSFDTKRTIEIPLRPIVAPRDQPAIALRIGNLCGDNPLEWDELELRNAEDEDADFKWIYRLMEPVSTGPNPVDAVTPILKKTMPIPMAKLSAEERVGGNCFGAKITHA